MPPDQISIVSRKDGKEKVEGQGNNAAEGAGTGAEIGVVAGGAAGGIVGAMISSGVPEKDAHLYAEALRRGGSVVIAKVADDKVAASQTILNDARAVDLDDLRAKYSAVGPERSDPYDKTQIADFHQARKSAILRFRRLGQSRRESD
ncbi:hypothetical protein [Rhizobium sp. A37_96]